MDAREALLDHLAELKAAHDKTNRLMTEITAVAARAVKGSGVLPSLSQLRAYEQALLAAQGEAACCAELLQQGRRPAPCVPL
jgi:hypothetical protein